MKRRKMMWKPNKQGKQRTLTVFTDEKNIPN